jgi:hypothetical protein
MSNTFPIMLTTDEKNHLHLMLEDMEARYRAKIILLKDDGYSITTNKKDNDGIISKTTQSQTTQV